MNRPREELAVFLLAVQLLTRWPVRSPAVFTEARLAASPRYSPLVSTLVGAFAGGVFWLAHLVFPLSLALVLSTAASLLATGALHEGGFADICDCLGGDCLGGVQQTSELGMYLGVVAAT